VAWDEAFTGVIDEFAYINQGRLTDARIAQLYSFSQTNWAANGFTIVTNGPGGGGTAPSLGFATASASAFTLSWPESTAGYYLEYTTNLASGLWISNSIPPVIVNGNNTITEPIGSGSKFFRLAQ
jgi:hypothetical protein